MSEATIRQLIDAFNRHDAAGFASMYAAEAVVHDPQYEEPLRGRQRVQDDMQTFFRTFPDISGTLGAVILKDNEAAFEGSFRGTNKGPLTMPGGEVPPTNKSVTMTGAMFVRFNGQGQIEEERRYFNMADMMAQLGLMP